MKPYCTVQHAMVIVHSRTTVAGDAVVQVHGNLTTMNFGNILFTNVSDSLYLKNDCAKIGSFQALVDEIYNKVCRATTVLVLSSVCSANSARCCRCRDCDCVCVRVVCECCVSY